jgi:hypothetical protein
VHGTPPLQMPVYEFTEAVRGSTPRVLMQMKANTRFGVFWDKLLFPQSSTLLLVGSTKSLLVIQTPLRTGYIFFTSLNPCCTGKKCLGQGVLCYTSAALGYTARVAGFNSRVRTVDKQKHFF